MLNKHAWEKPDIVEFYVQDRELQPPEETILRICSDRLSEMKMLDIGVGAGRTTRHFAELAREYVGIDYSEKMIAKCKENLSGFSGNISFFECDVRSMEMFDDNEFDLILFSFNGLDYIPHHDRLQALQEIHRIGKPGGFFCFSTHNLHYMKYMFGLWHQLTWRPRTMLKRLLEWCELSFVHNNPFSIMRMMRGSSHAIFNDGGHDYSHQTYYIDPTAQIEQLSNHFQDIRIFLSDGCEAKNTELEEIDDWWIYFLCTIKA